MKKKLLLLAVACLAGCQYIPGLNDTQESVPQEAAVVEEVDEIVEIPADTAFLSMSAEEKATAYAALDRIQKSSKDSKSPLSFSQVTELKSEQEYTDKMLKSLEEPFILYLGFDECPYCKAFTPKLNQLAQEYKVPIYYYNVRKRNQDPNFESAMTIYNITTVPHAFVIKNAKPGAKINHASTMAEIEQFVADFANQ